MRLSTLGTVGLPLALALAGPVMAAPAGTITFAIPAEPATVDPAIEVAGPGYRVLLQLYEGLLEYRGNTTELAPRPGAFFYQQNNYHYNLSIVFYIVYGKER